MNLNLMTGMNAFLGYGHVGINICKNLSELGINVSLSPIGNIQLSTNDHALIQSCVNNQDNFDYNSPCLKIWHENQLSEKIGNGKYFTLSFFELDTLNERRKHHLNYSDHIITPSKWGRDVMLNNGITKPISVINMGINNSIFYPVERSKQETFVRDKYIFLVIGKWEIRKSHSELQTIFNKAFTKDDNVELHMMCHNPFLNQEETTEWENYYKRSTLGEKIKIIKPVATDAGLAKIINNADCMISLSKSEGWNLPATQALSCGKNLIITNYSAHTQYCTSENSHLVEITETEEALDGRWFGFGTDNIGQWAHIGPDQEEQAIFYMRECYKERKIFNEEGIKTAQSLTWKHTSTRIRDLIFNEKGEPND